MIGTVLYALQATTSAMARPQKLDMQRLYLCNGTPNTGQTLQSAHCDTRHFGILGAAAKHYRRKQDGLFSA